MPSLLNRIPPRIVPTIVAPMPQPASTEPTSAGENPCWIRNGTAITFSKPSGQR